MVSLPSLIDDFLCIGSMDGASPTTVDEVVDELGLDPDIFLHGESLLWESFDDRTVVVFVERFGDAEFRSFVVVRWLGEATFVRTYRVRSEEKIWEH